MSFHGYQHKAERFEAIAQEVATNLTNRTQRRRLVTCRAIAVEARMTAYVIARLSCFIGKGGRR